MFPGRWIQKTNDTAHITVTKFQEHFVPDNICVDNMFFQ